MKQAFKQQLETLKKEIEQNPEIATVTFTRGLAVQALHRFCIDNKLSITIDQIETWTDNNILKRV